MQVVVANPSSTPEITAAAEGLGRAGLLGRYHVPIAFDAGQDRWTSRLAGPASYSILRELRRRPLPPHVPAVCVRRTATLSDLARVAVQRAPHAPRKAKEAWSDRHFQIFDRVVSRSLRASDDAFFGVAGEPVRRSVLRSRELGIETWLDFPLAHHASIVATLREEARRVPEYARTLQLVSPHATWLVEEIHCQAVAADHVLVASSYSQRTFVEAGIPAEKMHLTPLGADTELFHPAPRPDDGVFRILFVGQITQRKGVSYLVDAFRAAAIPHSELLLAGAIVGDAPWAGRRGVRHQPPLPRSELPAVYACADVSVLPSLAEGFGLTAMEAMASGRPVIVSEHTFGRDVVDDGVNGWTVPIRDVEAIVDRLRILAGDPDLRARMGRAARATAERFTWQRYGDRVADLMSSA